MNKSDQISNPMIKLTIKKKKKETVTELTR